MKPEAKAREVIDTQLQSAGWVLQDYKQLDPHASLGVAVREFPGCTGPGDYALLVDGKVGGFLEAKAVGLLGIRILGQASAEGRLEVLDKCRGEDAGLMKAVLHMKKCGWN